MLAGRDDIPALPISRTTVGDLDRSQVGAEVARKFVNEKTFSIRCLQRTLAGRAPTYRQPSERATHLDLDIGEGPSSAVVALMGLGGGSFVEGSDRPG